MKIFISCPFTGLCDEEKYEVKEEYKDFFNKLIKAIEERNCEYYLAIKRENWGIEHKGPEECTKSDYEGVKSSDLLIVIPGNNTSKGISGGVHIELGWASALKKKMHILIEDNFEYSPVLMGLNVLSSTQYHKCNNFLDDIMLDKIVEIIDQELMIMGNL